jgi:hypothetical protein
MAGLNGQRAIVPKPKVAVLYQAIEPPVINGVRKPMKPGGKGKDRIISLAVDKSNEKQGIKTQEQTSHSHFNLNPTSPFLPHV